MHQILNDLEIALGHAIETFDPPFVVTDQVQFFSNLSLIESVNKCMLDLISSVPDGGKILIPLSGGFDCRLFLWVINELQLLSKFDVITKTFGYAGGWDYTAAGAVCNELKIKFCHVKSDGQEFDLDAELDKLSHAKVPWNELYFNQKALTGTHDLSLTGFMGNTLVGNHYVGGDEKSAVELFLKKYAPTFVGDLRIVKYFLEHIPFGFSNALLTPYEELIVIIRQNNYIQPLLRSQNASHPFLHPVLRNWCLSLRGIRRENQNGYRTALRSLGGVMNLPSQSLMMGSLKDTKFSLGIRRNVVRVKKLLYKHELYKTENYEPFSVMCKNQSFVQMVNKLSARSNTQVNNLRDLNREMLKQVL